jgi:hypothetical protein
MIDDGENDRSSRGGSDTRATKPRRWFDAAALVSTTILGATVVLWLIGSAISPLSITDSFHIGVWSGFDGRLVFYNDKEYGPYHGSIIALSDAPPPRVQIQAWGNSFGVYYRHFYFPKSGKTLWTLAISLLYPFFLFAIVPLAWGRCRWWSARR